MDEHGIELKRARAVRREPSGAGYAGAFDAERAGVVADGDAAQGYALWTAANSGGERAAASVGGANSGKSEGRAGGVRFRIFGGVLQAGELATPAHGLVEGIRACGWCEPCDENRRIFMGAQG